MAEPGRWIEVGRVTDWDLEHLHVMPDSGHVLQALQDALTERLGAAIPVRGLRFERERAFIFEAWIPAHLERQQAALPPLALPHG